MKKRANEKSHRCQKSNAGIDRGGGSGGATSKIEIVAKSHATGKMIRSLIGKEKKREFRSDGGNCGDDSKYRSHI